jgi:hypothetical protein
VTPEKPRLSPDKGPVAVHTVGELLRVDGAALPRHPDVAFGLRARQDWLRVLEWQYQVQRDLLDG